MELNQIFTFLTKNYQNVASPPEEENSDTVLLFEPRISYPALRVTEINFLFRFDRFLKQFAKKIAKKIEKKSNFQNFRILSFFFQNFSNLYPNFWPSHNL